ncbi:GNAT family N-acetyltransferase [Prosthecomicrobium sp. N25]|uniref:GNAT family N-acetyltransferase n=1 Tax=Prosthecomicrobium sp. N25 TaxID=3129254 RepID=UPI003077FFBF
MSDLVLRRATPDDVPRLVELYAEDMLGQGREATGADDLPVYREAFARVDADPSTTLFVAEREGRVVGTFQLTITPGLASRGVVRATVEAVRIEAAQRGRGLGSAMMRLAVEEAARRGADAVQLTSNKARTEAHRFYETLGFKRSHEGFKLDLPRRR